MSGKTLTGMKSNSMNLEFYQMNKTEYELFKGVTKVNVLIRKFALAVMKKYEPRLITPLIYVTAWIAVVIDPIIWIECTEPWMAEEFIWGKIFSHFDGLVAFPSIHLYPSLDPEQSNLHPPYDPSSHFSSP